MKAMSMGQDQSQVSSYIENSKVQCPRPLFWHFSLSPLHLPLSPSFGGSAHKISKGSNACADGAEMASQVDASTLDGMSKKELVVLVQSVAPLELLQSNQVRERTSCDNKCTHLHRNGCVTWKQWFTCE